LFVYANFFVNRFSSHVYLDEEGKEK